MKLAYQPAKLAVPVQRCVRLARVQRVAVRASAPQRDAQETIVKSAAFASLAGSFLVAGNAQAAMEVANLAAGDARPIAVVGLLGLALTWVLFNIGGPALNQLDSMGEKKGASAPAAKKKRSVAAGLGLGFGAASLLAAQSADAATEAMQLAAGDARPIAVVGLLGLALTWVLFNIGGPALNQLDSMGEKKGASAPAAKKKRSVAAGVGLGFGAASLLAAQSADAATEAMQLAAGDARPIAVVGLLGLALTWVLFNIGGPALNQLDSMGEKKGASAPAAKKKRSVAAGVGLGFGAASLLAAQNADAATEAMQLAAGDARGFAVIGLLGLALTWVGFNIGGPALNQLDKMSNK